MLKQAGILIFFLIGMNLGSLEAQSPSDDKAEAITLQENILIDKGYELNGYIRGGFYGWVSGLDRRPELKSGYGEVALKLKTTGTALGNGYAEIRLRKGYEYGLDLFEIQLREAYVNGSLGPLDFRVGQQIVAWGRADGINPTNNITPQNYLVRSPHFDDRREGNMTLRAWLHVSPFRLETIWVPFYKSSIPPFERINFPVGVSFSDSTVYPDHQILNSSYALRLHFDFLSFDGSLSYYNGYYHLPALDGIVDLAGLHFYPVAYRAQAIGADFSTTLGVWGVRGEAAYKFTVDDYTESLFLPSPEFQYVLGVDGMLGNINFIIQYIGKYIPDFEKLDLPINPLEIPAYEITKANRMFSMQQDKISHSLSNTLSWNLFYETFKVEFRSLYHFTTKEYLVNPNLSYDITDALNVTLGGNYYRGPEGTLYDITDDLFSDIYMEIKYAF